MSRTATPDLGAGGRRAAARAAVRPAGRSRSPARRGSCAELRPRRQRGAADHPGRGSARKRRRKGRRGPGDAPNDAEITWRKDGGAPQQVMVPVGRDVPLPVAIDHGGPNVLELAVAPGPHELTLVNNRAVVVVNGVRDRLRVLLGHRRALCRRARLAQHPQIRSVGRPRPFHDPAPAGKAGRHADPRAVADRLSDPRAVRHQARRFRPDHLRPLQSARADPAGLSRERRALRAQRRRLSRSRRSRLRHADEPLAHAVGPDPAGRADRECL